ncbi:MAG TPA: luciferase family protein [Terriglobales bacterium]
MDTLEKLEQELASWPQVSVHPHRFGGREFRFGAAEIGHLHIGGNLDIPFPRSVRDALLTAGLVIKHYWVPNSGWTTYRVRTERDLQHALWLLRLSYLRYRLKTAAEPQLFLESESTALHLTPELKSLFTQLLPATAHTRVAV